MNLVREIGPLILFFASYKFYGLVYATVILSAVMCILVLYDYFTGKKIQLQVIISTGLLVVFAAISFFTGNMTFIKIKLTIINLLFGLILCFGVYFKKGFVRYIFGSSVVLSDHDWVTLSKRFGLFFLSLAVLNEIIWRNFSEEFWVNFKTFGVIGVTFLFALTQVSFLSKKQIEQS